MYILGQSKPRASPRSVVKSRVSCASAQTSHPFAQRLHPGSPSVAILPSGGPWRCSRRPPVTRGPRAGVAMLAIRMCHTEGEHHPPRCFERARHHIRVTSSRYAVRIVLFFLSVIAVNLLLGLIYKSHFVLGVFV